MRLLFLRPQRLTNRGFVSVLVMLFLVSVVLFILGKSLSMSGSKSLETQQYFDSVAALALAESGREAALASITSSVMADDSAFASSCAALANGTPVGLGLRGGTFQLVPSTTPTTSNLCPIRVKGTVGTASRTVESQINFNSQIGTGGYGTDPTMTLNNPYSVPAAAVFNLAWRRQGSTGNNPPGGQAVASACTLPSCGMQWNLESSSGNPSVGSLGTALGVGAKSSVSVVQSLDSPRNYVEVGMILGGLSGMPARTGSYSDSKETANTSSQAVTTGTTPSGEPGSGPAGWCSGADTLVFGVSGRGDDDPTAAYTSVVFNSNGSPAQPIPMTWVAHYPNTDGTSPNTHGDVFSEIWYTYNPYVRMTAASSTGTTVTVASTAGLQTGTILKVYSGTGEFQGNTRVNSITSATQFIVSLAPATPLSGATICGGICALFNNPASNAAKTTTFALTRSNSAAQQWAGGFACFSGVDPSKIRRVTSSTWRLQLWHEVISGE